MESHTKSTFAENYLFETCNNYIQKRKISYGYACWVKLQDCHVRQPPKLHEESLQACHAPILSRSKDIFPSLINISVTLMNKVTCVGFSLNQPAALMRHVMIVARWKPAIVFFGKFPPKEEFNNDIGEFSPCNDLVKVVASSCLYHWSIC